MRKKSEQNCFSFVRLRELLLRLLFTSVYVNSIFSAVKDRRQRSVNGSVSINTADKYVSQNKRIQITIGIVVKKKEGRAGCVW